MSSDPIERLKVDIAEGRVVAVVGAGVSSGATNRNSIASWIGLLESGVRHCLNTNPQPDAEWVRRIEESIASGKTDELLSAAGKITKRLAAPSGGDFRRWLSETVGALRASEPTVIQALSGLGVQIATTNYDSLLEEVTGMEPVTWLEHSRVHSVIQGREKAVLHL